MLDALSPTSKPAAAYVGLRGLVAALFWAYLLLMPLAHWLAPSGWLPLPNVPLLLAAALCLVGGIGHFRLSWRDLVLCSLVTVAVFSTLLNGGTLTSKSVNHMAALLFVSALNYFVGGRVVFSVMGNRWRTPVMLGFLFACALCVVEFAMVNFLDIPLPGYRPSGVDYGSTFILGVRPRSTFSESGHFAFYLACIAPLLVAAYASEERIWLVRTVILAVACCSILLFSTTLFIVIALWGCIYVVLRRIYLKPAGIAVIVLCMAVLVVFSAQMLELADILVLHKFRLYSFDDRQEKFIAVLDLVRESGFSHVLFGYGMGSFQGLGMEDSISSYANFLRDAGMLGLALFVAMILPLEAVNPVVPRVWQAAFLYLGVGVLIYFSAVPNYYFPHLAFALGLMSSSNCGSGMLWRGESAPAQSATT
jgi:hypothetical protein